MAAQEPLTLLEVVRIHQELPYFMNKFEMYKRARDYIEPLFIECLKQRGNFSNIK